MRQFFYSQKKKKTYKVFSFKSRHCKLKFLPCQILRLISKFLRLLTEIYVSFSYILLFNCHYFVEISYQFDIKWSFCISFFVVTF